MDFYANKSFDELLAELEEMDRRDEVIKAEIKKQEKERRERREQLERLCKKIAGHYEDVNFRKYMNMFSLYSSLDYGTDIDVGGGEWTTTHNVDDRKKCMRILRDAYRDIGHLENQLIEDWEEMRDFPYRDVFEKEENELRGKIQSLYLLCKYYHEEVEFLDEYLDEPGQTGEYGGITKNPIPMELCTPAASCWLQKAVKAGFLDENYKPTEKLDTRGKQALFAEMFSEKTGIKCMFKPFETLWSVKRLRQQKYKRREITGKVNGDGEIIAFFE